MAKDEILLKLKLEASKAKVDIKSLSSELEKMDKRTTEAKDKMLKLEMAEVRLANANIKLKKHNEELNKSFTSLNKKLDGSTKASGAGTSAALELGRVISDMPYGIRGVANNLSQFASNITFMATSVDAATGKVVGISGAIKGLWRSLMGPFGILLAIQAVISALDAFSNQQKEASESTDELSNKLKKQDFILMELSERYLKYNKNQQLNDFITRAIIQKESKLSKVLKDSSKSQEEKNRVIEEYLRLKKLEIENENRLTKINDLRSKQSKKELEIREKYKNFVGSDAQMNKEIQDSVSKTSVELDKQLDSYVATLSEIQKITDKLFPKDESKKGKSKKSSKIEFLESPEEFQAKATDIESKTLSLQQKLSIIESRNKEERLAREYDFQVKSLQLTIDTEKEKAEIRLQKYIEDINRKVESGKIDEYEAKEAIERARATSKKEVEAIDTEYQPLFAILHNIFLAKKKALGGGEDDDSMRVEDYIATFKTAYSGLNDFLNSEFDRQMTIEQNKTNALNEELNNRLLNEQLSSQERKSIQNQIWQNDEALRKKQEQIAKKKFKTEKAFNISMAIVDTYAGATRALNDKTVPSTIARFALAGATITSGLLQVASIARQQFQSSSASTPIRTGAGGGAGGGVGDRSFNFTLAGQTEGNQLVDAIQSQFNNPIRAYVVSGDVTNQQQLDANIQSSASF